MTLLRRVLRALALLPRLIRRSIAKGWNDRLLGLSAETAFWQIVSLPSLALALIASLGYVSRWFGPDTVNRAEDKLLSGLGKGFSPSVVDKVIKPTLDSILRDERADVISIGFVLALWAGSSAMATYVNTVTIAYDQRDLRGAVRSRVLALVLFLGSVLLGVIVLPMLVLGPDLLERPFSGRHKQTVSTLISIGYYPVLVLFLLAGLATFYKLAPPRRLPWHRGLPGAIFAMVIFLGGSAGLREYVSFILDKNHAYATLASPIAALLFFYVLAFGVLLGAEFNAVIEEHKPARIRHHHVLDPRHWSVFQTAPTEPLPRGVNGADNGAANGHTTKRLPDVSPLKNQKDQPSRGPSRRR